MIDTDPLQELERDLGQDRLRALLRCFLADMRSNLDSLSAAVEMSDADGIQRAAHTLASTCATFGMIRTATFAKRTDFAARRGDPGTTRLARKLLNAAPADLEALGQLFPDIRDDVVTDRPMAVQDTNRGARS